MKDSKNHMGSTIIPGVQRKNYLKQYRRDTVRKAHGLDSQVDAAPVSGREGLESRPYRDTSFTINVSKSFFGEKNSLLNKCFSENCLHKWKEEGKYLPLGLI